MLTNSIKTHILRSILKKKYSTIETLFDKKKVQEYFENGYAVIPKVFSASRIDDLKAEVDKVISHVDPKEIKSVFTCDHKDQDNYFLDSSDKVDTLI
jgi:hypothetical protein